LLLAGSCATACPSGEREFDLVTESISDLTHGAAGLNKIGANVFEVFVCDLALYQSKLQVLSTLFADALMAWHLRYVAARYFLESSDLMRSRTFPVGQAWLAEI
jgi:hypothetical protein